jgi:hypothetical protein
MTYYHYTTRYGALHIARLRRVLKGRGVLADGSTIAPQLGVNLTTSPSCIGHGLHLGQRLRPDLIQALPSTVWVKKNPKDPTDIRLLDHSAYRLEIELEPSDSKLQSATDYYAKNPRLLKNLALTGYNPLFDYLTDRERSLYSALFASGDLQDMSPTWYYYFDDISVFKVKSISQASSFDLYSDSFACSDWLKICGTEAESFKMTKV